MKYFRRLWNGEQEDYLDAGKPKCSEMSAKFKNESAMLSAINNAKVRIASLDKRPNSSSRQQVKDEDESLLPTYKREGGKTIKDSLSQFFK